MKKFTILLFLWFFSNHAIAQTLVAYDNMQNKVFSQMEAEGFQSISIKQEGELFFLAYENRVYRYEVAAIRHIIQLIAPTLKGKVTQLILITRKQQIPIVATKVKLVDYFAFVAGEIDLEIFTSRLQITQNDLLLPKNGWSINNKNTGTFRLEIVIEPDIKLALGGKPDPIQHQFNLIPTANLYLWKGALLKLQGILPISNELAIPEETIIRPGILSLSQQIRLPNNLFVGVSVGYFTNYRYGTSIDVAQYFFNGNLALRGQIGYTGYASYPKRLGVDELEKIWQYGELEYTDYKFGVDYFVAKWNLKVGVEYGKVLYHKNIFQVSLNQRFKEIEFGLFGFKTDDGNNYGINLTIPIFPKKYWKPKAVSIRPSSHLSYTYFSTERYVNQYKTGINLALQNQSFNPALLQNLLASEDWD